jgi:hypothetical protein
MSNIETREDFLAVLAERDWKPGRDEVGDRFAEKNLGEVIVVGLLGRRDTRYAGNSEGVLIMGLSLWVTTVDISVAYTIIRFPRKRLAEHCIVCQTDGHILKKPFITRDDVVKHSDEAIAWAKSCDIDAGLKTLRELPTNSKGAFPRRHLAALAEAGDVETLTRYRDSFASGERAGFSALYITDEFITRALEFAMKRKADPNWLPKWPRMRV